MCRKAKPAPAGFTDRLEGVMERMKVRYSDTFTVEAASGGTIVRFEVRSILDAATTREVAEDLYALVDQHGMIDLVLDMTGVRFLSSQMLGTLVNLQRKARAAGGKVVLTEVAPNITRMFRITRLDSVLTIQDQAGPMPETAAGHGGCALSSAGDCRSGWTASPTDQVADALKQVR
jgi:anti-sigma B factor antagonist